LFGSKESIGPPDMAAGICLRIDLFGSKASAAIWLGFVGEFIGLAAKHRARYGWDLFGTKLFLKSWFAKAGIE
jgi:hypothetical protein